MAVYRLEAKVISRSKGRSATASAAYRSGARIEDQRTGQTFDYSRMRGVRHSEILAPAGTPDWMYDREKLWNAVELAEKRRDAQLARDFTISLPHELTHEQRVELLRDYLRTEFVDRGMIADVSIHAPDRKGDPRNHHAHVMLTMRSLTGNGFGPKVREWNATEQLESWRERWAKTVNRHLERHGQEARVDHRSLADQGIDREPEPKQGPVATEMERDGKTSHAGDDRRAAKERNEARAELASQLGAIKGELIYLDPDMLRRRDQTPAFDPSAGDKRARPRARTPLATPDGGMVAQQAEAMRRFKRNSERLETARQRREASAEARPSTDETRIPIDVDQGREGRDDMASKYDKLKSEHGKAAPAPEQEAGRSQGKGAETAQQRAASPNWSMDQSMAAQNASANAWVKAGHQRRQETGAQHDNPGQQQSQGPKADRGEQKPQRSLRFAEDREGQGRDQSGPQQGQSPERQLRFAEDRTGRSRDYGGLKREQSAAEPAKESGGEKKLNFAKGRGPTPELDR